jgi:hypothetical protein
LPTTIDGFLTRKRLQLGNVLVDDRLQAGSAFGQRALPTTLFFDARGRLVSTRIGEVRGQGFDDHRHLARQVDEVVSQGQRRFSDRLA